MDISEQGLGLIKRFEGFSARMYYCPAGKRTIGYGHVIQTFEGFPRTGISPEEAEALLKDDTQETAQAVSRLVEIGLEQWEFDALVSLTYNIGMRAFEKSTLLRVLNTENKQEAAGQFDRWVYVREQKTQGLILRRAAEKALFLGQGVPN